MPAHHPLGGQVPAHRPLGGQVWAPLCAGTWPPRGSCAGTWRCQHIEPQGSGVGTSEIELCSLLIVLAWTTFFWRFLRHIGTFLDHLGGVDTPMGRVLALKIQANLSKYMGEGRSICQLLLGPHAPSFFWTSIPATSCLHTHGWAKIHPNHPHYLQAIFTWFKPSQHQLLSYTHNRIIHNAIYIGILNGTHLWEVYSVQNVCYPVRHPSCQPFALTVDWMPAKYSIRLGDAVSQNKNLVHGTLLAAGMFAPTHNGCRHLQPWWLSRFFCHTMVVLHSSLHWMLPVIRVHV